ncbi:DoxX family protein [Winogradskyella sp. PC-19]|uniref:DoxX family protein n=1 Tax=unclassified Winogradskyella TaxID=2615021 RepID=UPI000B3CE727|nr:MULTISPECIES: DoxX family protein [unclassified Winogradskyella]ARV08686.1 DoxX family protein [Winogradskyella sp. PC-19]RZN78354.1 MAG: DoxX family protein [Winogradskyella sp.]
MIQLKSLFKFLITPVIQKNWYNDVLIAIPRIICGLLLTASFGADKFGMPWTADSQNLNLFEVSAWFPEDVAAYGGIFAVAPIFFAWMGAFSEAVGGLFLMLGLKTRIASFLIMCTMLVPIFMQKWNQGLWAMLPAMGFLWISVYNLILGSGRFGLDYIIGKKLK